MNGRPFGGAVAALVSFAFAGCTTMVEFTSSPPGAAVRYLDQTIGTTPFTYGVTDQFGWWSTYTFAASRDGYEPQTLAFQERTPLDAQNIMPPEVHFELKQKPGATPPPAATQAPVSPAPVARAAPVPAPVAPPPPPAPVATADASSDVKAAVNAWAAAWSRRDFDAYLAAYSPEFTGSRNSRGAWEAERRSRIAPRKKIEVTLSGVEVSVQGNRATATFSQRYASEVVNSVDRKSLELVRDANGRWRIQRETVLGS